MKQSGLDELQDLLGGKRYETYIFSRCVFHQDEHPSFMAYEDWYRCLACGKEGSTQSLIKLLSNKPTRPQKQSYWKNPWSGWLKQFDGSLAKVCKVAWENLKKRPSIYLRERGIPDTIQVRLGLGLLDSYITFPIRNAENKIIGAVARIGEGENVGHKYILPSGQNPNLVYIPAWQLFDKSTTVYCTFGILDALTLVLYDVGAFSTTTGKRIDPKALDFIKKRIIFIPDYGEEQEANKIASKLGWRGATPKRLNYPDDCKDVNDVHMKYPEILQNTEW